MKIEYDKEVDAVYFQILEEPVIESEEVVADIIIDFTADNRVAGIEILNVSKQVEIMENLKKLLLLKSKEPLIASS